MRLILALMLLSVSFAQFSNPPLSDVTGNNTAAAPSLEGLYNGSIASNGTLTVHFGSYSQVIDLYASADIAGLTIMVDNMTSPSQNPSLLIARGYRQGHLISMPSAGLSNFRCDLAYFNNMNEQNWRCDFDNDSCVDYENQTYMHYGIIPEFTFRNITEAGNSSSTLVTIPQDILDAMANSSGTEVLDVNLTGKATFFDQVDSRTLNNGACTDNITTYSGSVPFSANASFLVAGDHKLFLLRSPVLRTQWFRDNQFDMVVLSQSPLYRASVYLNNDSQNITIRSFYVLANPYGIQEIFSNTTAPAGWSESSSNTTTPTPLEQDNQSFRYIYAFNYSYEGLGENDLSLIVYDSFNGTSGYQDSFLSRMASFNGTTAETGVPSSSVPSVPSVGFSEEQLAQLQIGLGLVAFVVVLAFVNFWVLS